MDGITNVGKQQQTQTQTQIQKQDTASSQIQQAREAKPKDLVKEIQKEVSSEPKINSKEQMQDLVDQLNKAMGPISTNISFAVDSNDIFYVSVKETESQRLIRRFPAEKAMDFLPKMQEVSGILFDIKG